MLSAPLSTVAGMFHPWRRLRALAQIDLVWAVMPGRLGETDGKSLIWLHPHQSQAQRRCTLAHELAHIELGHVEGCTAREESQTARLAARRLIPIEALADALVWTHHLDDVAEALWVDRDTLDVRLDRLHPSEHHYIRARLAARDDSA